MSWLLLPAPLLTSFGLFGFALLLLTQARTSTASGTLFGPVTTRWFLPTSRLSSRLGRPRPLLSVVPTGLPLPTLFEVPSLTVSLQALNELHELALDAARSAVCEYEQLSNDAAAQDDFQLANTYKHWAFGAELASHRVSLAFAAAFTAAYDEWEATTCPVLKDHTEVVLPDLSTKATPVKAEVVL